MVDERILELYNRRRELLKIMLGEIKDFSAHPTICDSLGDRQDLILEMLELSNAINDLCNDDFILLDMYRRLSLALSKEEYEEAIVIKEEIVNHKS